jgi:hypothetical protein
MWMAHPCRMTTPSCPQCRRVIPAADVNVANDVAFCRGCNLSHALSDLTHDEMLTAHVDLSRPPVGVWQRRDGTDSILGASHRSWGSILGSLFLCLFWNGIVSVFVCFNLANTFNLLHLSMPEWFPAPEMNGAPVGLGMTLFLWIFLTPFIAVGLGVLGFLLSSLGGRTEVRIRPGHGVIFTGVGPLGWRQFFDPASILRVRVGSAAKRGNHEESSSKTEIVMEQRGGGALSFGSMLREDRRLFLAAALRQGLR